MKGFTLMLVSQLSNCTHFISNRSTPMTPQGSIPRIHIPFIKAIDMKPIPQIKLVENTSWRNTKQYRSICGVTASVFECLKEIFRIQITITRTSGVES